MKYAHCQTSRMRGTPFRPAHAVLVLAALLVNCGKVEPTDGAAFAGGVASGAAPAFVGGADGGAARGGAVASGATGNQAGMGATTSGGSPGAGGTVVVLSGGKGGTPAQAGAAGDQSGSCDATTLWDAVLDGALGGLGTCEVSSVPAGTEPVNRFRGAIVIDGDGQVIDNTGLSGSEKQTWLDKLSAQRWVCLQNQTIGYKCRPAG